jgi:hypothetical protein
MADFDCIEDDDIKDGFGCLAVGGGGSEIASLDGVYQNDVWSGDFYLIAGSDTTRGEFTFAKNFQVDVNLK